jgi:hypothetical protein
LIFLLLLAAQVVARVGLVAAEQEASELLLELVAVAVLLNRLFRLPQELLIRLR